jgi:four helix bundle protein
VRQLTHERLDVYQKAIEFLAISVQLIGVIPKGYSTVSDQLKRASVSVVLNIAEAAGKPTPGENRKHFGISRGSALECGAALDTLRVLGVGEPPVIERGKCLLVDVVSMLTKLCR